MTSKLIAVIDDEPDIRELVSIHLKRAGFQAETFKQADDFLHFLNANEPDLIILDLMLPDADGLAQDMVRDSITAFVNRDADLAEDVCKRDDEVDSLNDQIFRVLLTYMLQDPKNIERALDLILVGRHLERIADHATNVGEDVIYLVKGKSIKHHFETRKISKM